MQKQVGQEHWVLDEKGNFKGLFSLSGEKARQLYGQKDFWNGVDHIIRDYMQLHPQEIKEQRIENQLTRDSNFNEFGSNQSGSFRQALELPVGLYTVLFEYEESLLTNKKTLHEFMKRYPIFTTAKTL